MQCIKISIFRAKKALSLFLRVQGFFSSKWPNFGSKWLGMVLWTPPGGHILILTSLIYHNPLMGELKYKQTKITQLFKCVTCIEVTYKWWNSWNALDCDSKLLGKYFPKCCMLSNETYETVQTRKVTINSDFWCPFFPSKKHQKIAENW